MYRKRFEYAQNAIAYKDIAQRIINLSHEIRKGDLVIEIGPGGGMLTEGILKKITESGSFIGVEIDENLCRKLSEKFSSFASAVFVNEDFMNYALPSEPFKIVANPPFNLTSEICRKILDPIENLQVAYLIMQKEAFEMLGGRKVGAQKETMKSLLYYPFWQVEKVVDMKRTDFIPRTSVSVVYARFSRRSIPLVATEKFQEYEDFIRDIAEVKVGQGMWRKIIKSGNVPKAVVDGLVFDRGIASQKAEVIVKVFNYYSTANIP